MPNQLIWEEHDPSGHLVSGDFWIIEINGRHYLKENDASWPDGFRPIGNFSTEQQAKDVADKL